MWGWLSSKVVTSVAVLVITGSFMGLFSMQADYYRTLELEDMANAITDLVTEVDLLTCQALVEVNWTDQAESHGLPRTFQGEPYMVHFTPERPYLVWNDVRVKGRYFPSPVQLFGPDGAPTGVLEVPSTTGFMIQSKPTWADWGLEHMISINALS
jgi:hypothetical protein